MADLRLARHLTLLFGTIERCPHGMSFRLGHPGRRPLSRLRAELDAHVEAGWLEEHIRREARGLVVRYRVLPAGWRAVDALIEEAAGG
jgi:hypothetical protein